METIAVVGISAGTLSIIGYLPQIITSQKLKSMKEVSFLLLLFTMSSLLWMMYGFYKMDLILSGLSMITFSMGMVLIIMKFVYEKKFLKYFSSQIKLKGKKSIPRLK